MQRSNIKFFFTFFAATMLFAVIQAHAVWQDAPAAPAQYGATPGMMQDDYKPINLGSAGQQKLGNFVLGTTTASLSIANLSLYMPSAGGLEGLHITRSSSSPLSWSYLNIEDENSSSIFKVHQNGNVGIGTTTPNYKFTVDGDYAIPQALISYDGSNGIFFHAQGSNTHYNWLIGQQRTVSDTIEFTPSTVVGGTTFSLPVFAIKQNGLIGTATSSALRFMVNNTERMRIGTGGNVGIGTTTLNYKLTVNGDANATRLCIASDCKDSWSAVTGGIQTLDSVTTNGPTTANSISVTGLTASRFTDLQNVSYYVDPSNNTTSAVLAGNITIGGSGTAVDGWFVSSDARLKKNVEVLSGSLDKIERVRGVSYNLIDGSSNRQIGVVAQELEQEFPELVKTDDNGYKSVAYDRLSAALIEAIKELRSQNQTLQQRLDHLDKKW